MEARFYRDCSEISIYNFNKVVETDDYSWLVVDYDGYKPVEFDEEQAADFWRDIYNEYTKLSDNNETALFYELLLEIHRLKIRRYFVTILIQELRIGGTQKVVDGFIDSLKKWRVFINPDRPLNTELDKAERQLRAAQNKIELKENELEQLKERQEDAISLEEQIVRLEQGLGRNNIDPKTTSVKKWLVMIKEYKALLDRQRKMRT